MELADKGTDGADKDAEDEVVGAIKAAKSRSLLFASRDDYK